MSSAKDPSVRRPHVWVATVAGILTATLGLVVLVAWHTHTVALIQVRSTLVPMQYNTAVCFLLSGIGVAALAHDRPRMVLVPASVVGALGLLTLVEYVLGVTLGIDELLFEAFITVETSTPGRMAPNTALSFCLTAAALLTNTLSRRPDRRFWVIGGLGVFVLVLGSVAFFGYVTGAETGFGWGRLTRMAAHTAIGFVTLALGILALAFREGATWVSTSGALTPTTMVREGRRIVAASVAIMTMASLAVGISITRELYSTALDSQRDRLEELAMSRIAMIEAVARFDEENSQDVPGGARAATRGQVVEAHERSSGFGETGEFTLATREGDVVVFLVRPPGRGRASLIASTSARVGPSLCNAHWPGSPGHLPALIIGAWSCSPHTHMWRRSTWVSWPRWISRRFAHPSYEAPF